MSYGFGELMWPVECIPISFVIPILNFRPLHCLQEQLNPVFSLLARKF